MMNQTVKAFTVEEAKNASRRKGKPFCKVCFDAGKTETEYTSHYLKSAPGPDGKLVCPTLLNQACLTCGQKGHTSSFCNKQCNKQCNEDKHKRRSRHRVAPEFTDDQHELQSQLQSQLQSPLQSQFQSQFQSQSQSKPRI